MGVLPLGDVEWLVVEWLVVVCQSDLISVYYRCKLLFALRALPLNDASLFCRAHVHGACAKSDMQRFAIYHIYSLLQLHLN